MVDQKDIFTGASELFVAQEYFFPQTKNGKALVQPGGFLLPRQPKLAEEMIASAYVRLLELEAREEEIDQDFLNQAIVVFDWIAGSSKSEDDNLSGEKFSLEGRQAVFQEQVQFLTRVKEEKIDSWQNVLKTMLRGHVWAICQHSSYNYRGNIEKLSGVEKLLRKSIAQEEHPSKS